MKLTNTEKRIIERYRADASVNIYQWVDTYEEVEQAIEGFRIVKIYEMDEKNIVFGSGSLDNPRLTVYLSTGKEVEE